MSGGAERCQDSSDAVLAQDVGTLETPVSPTTERARP